MKGKKGLYILLPLVIALWGYIGFKVYDQVKAPEQEIVDPQYKPIVHNVKKEKQFFRLDLKYNDPFLKQASDGKTKSDKEKTLNKKKRTWMWPQIVYRGCIENHKKTVGMLQLDNRDYLVQKGMLVKDFLVKSINSDSLVMQREGERRSFSKIK